MEEGRESRSGDGKATKVDGHAALINGGCANHNARSRSADVRKAQHAITP
jgi:hypothetical protein